MPPPLAFSDFANALLCGGALAVACAVLSVIVVLRRWAFIGEGISHAGFGGLGTAWLLSLAVPALGTPAAAYAVAVLFCVAVALCIGYVSRADGADRRGAPEADVAIGIFLVASLAWGFLALHVYRKHSGADAADWERYLFGDVAAVSSATLTAGLAVSAAVLVTVAALFKEILAYAFDPLLARVSGIRSGFIHYLLMVLLALVIVIGMRIAGNVLVTALLVLPGDNRTAPRPPARGRPVRVGRCCRGGNGGGAGPLPPRPRRPPRRPGHRAAVVRPIRRRLRRDDIFPTAHHRLKKPGGKELGVGSCE